MSDLRRQKQTGRIAQESESPRKPWIAGVVIVLGIAAGIGAAYHLAKIEWAIPFGIICLFCISFLIGEIPQLRRKFSTYGRVSLQALFFVTVCAICYSPAWAEYKKQHAALNSGVLRPASDGKDHSMEEPALQIGDGGTFFKWVGAINEPILKRGVDKIKIRRDGNEIKFSTTVRDRFGSLIVSIEDNVWTTSSIQSNCWDKNYTDDSLEVKDGKGRVVLQVRLLPDRVQLQIEWPDQSGGKPSAMVEQGMYSEDEGIRPRFKYSSAEHWGELDPRSGYAKTN